MERPQSYSLLLLDRVQRPTNPNICAFGIGERKSRGFKLQISQRTLLQTLCRKSQSSEICLGSPELARPTWIDLGTCCLTFEVDTNSGLTKVIQPFIVNMPWVLLLGKSTLCCDFP